MVLLVCGYWYATRDGRSRLRLKRTSGWEVYFLVALYGSVFVFQGFNLVVMFWGMLFLLSSIMNIYYQINSIPTQVHLHSNFMNLTFFHLQAPLLLMLAFALLLCFFRTLISPRKELSNNSRTHFYQELTKADGVGNLLFNSMENNEMITLRLMSGRRYVGVVYAAINESTSHGNLILLPLLEGCDGPGELGFTVKKNHCALYEDELLHNQRRLIDKALKLRLVIMSHQVESISYFQLLARSNANG
ncbi:hypothetical protein [Serratia proteamaculans]|uniref:hypothetical protein n=1 Tax=Serratia proteamaculans TaxID=28151 RepID=UPI003CF77B5E